MLSVYCLLAGWVLDYRFSYRLEAPALRAFGVRGSKAGTMPACQIHFESIEQVQALRSVEPYLNLEKLYVLGTNCVDNGPREGLESFLQAASSDPDTVLHYEFMQVRPA